MLGFDFSIAGIESLGAMMIIAMVFTCYCFAIHLIVTWNPYHRPAIPLVSSLILCMGPMLAMSLEKDGDSSFAEMLEIAFLFKSCMLTVVKSLLLCKLFILARCNPSTNTFIVPSGSLRSCKTFAIVPH